MIRLTNIAAPALLLLTALLPEAVGAPVRLRFRPQGEVQVYRTEMRQEEALVGPESRFLLKDFRILGSQERSILGIGAGALEVHSVTRPLRAIREGKQISLPTEDLASSKTQVQDARGRSDEASWAPVLPEKAVQVGTTWKQRVKGPDGSPLVLRCKLDRIRRGRSGRLVARVLFRATDTNEHKAQDAQSKWRVRGKWSLDVEAGLLLASEIETDLVARYAEPLSNGTDRFRRKIVRSMRWIGSRPHSEEAVD